jgi:cytochrome P450
MAQAADIARSDIPSHIDPSRVVDFDLFGDRRFIEAGHPYDGLVNLIAEVGRGMFWTPRNGGHWFITDHELLFEVARTPEQFSSVNTSVPPVPPEDEQFLPPLSVDPPEHAKYRMPLMRAFAPAKIRQLEKDIRTVARELVDSIIDKGRCDFLTDVAEPLPVTIFMQLMGFDLSRYKEFRVWAAAMGRDNIEERAGAFRNTIDMARPLFEARRVTRGEDLLSQLLDETIDGRPMSQYELESTVCLLFGAGLDTVVNSLAFSMEHLARNPELQEELRAKPGLVGEAVEEMLRRYAVAFPFRSVKEDSSFHGIALKAGERVVMSVGMANLDSAAFPDAARYDLHRENKTHMTFNTGPHRCVGSHLARTELLTLFDEWVRRMPNVRVDPDNPPAYRTGLNFAITTLPLVWDVA